jgi:O-antigen ligase
MMAFLIATLKVQGRLKLVVGLLCLVLTSVTLLPDSIRARYSTLISDTQVIEESREGRKHLLKQSLKLTWENPLLGVGPGMFAVAEHGLSVAMGLERGLWHATHNMYTQVSSEVGIPAAVAFCTALVLAFRTFRRIQREARATHPRIESLAYWLSVAMVGFCAAGFFLSVAYEGHMPAILGLATALDAAWTKARATDVGRVETSAPRRLDRPESVQMSQVCWPGKTSRPAERGKTTL